MRWYFTRVEGRQESIPNPWPNSFPWLCCDLSKQITKSIKPINNNQVINFAKNTSKIFTIEEHSIIGGLGGAISEILMESNISNIFFKRIALSDTCHNKSGSQQYLRKINGLSSELLTKQILSYVK